MIWAQILILCCAVTRYVAAIKADPTAREGNVESVCHGVATSISVYGQKFTDYPLPQSCSEFHGVGDMALKKFFLQDSSCYKNIAPAMCALQYVDYEASSTCKKTYEFFFDLLETCKQDSSLASSYATCSSYDHGTKTIGDPDSFCNNSYLKIDESSDAEGYPANSIIKTFEAGEKLDCKRIAESYNACLIVAVGRLGYTEHFCNGGGFGAYCQKYPTVVKNLALKAICENIVIPYIMEVNQRLGSRSNYCDDIYSKYLMFLSIQKADMLLKAKSAKDSLNSLQRTNEMINSFKKNVVELRQDNINLENESTVLFNRLRQLSNQKMAVDHNIKMEFQRLVEASAKAEVNNKNMKFIKPEGVSPDETLDVFSSTRPVIEAVVVPQKQALEAVRETKRMIDAGGHVSYAQTYGFYPIEIQEIEDERERIKRLSEYIQSFTVSYATEIDKIPLSKTSEDMQIRNDGKRYSELADIFAEQTAILVRYQRSGNESGNSIAAAIEAASRSAAAQGKATFA